MSQSLWSQGGAARKSVDPLNPSRVSIPLKSGRCCKNKIVNLTQHISCLNPFEVREVLQVKLKILDETNNVKENSGNYLLEFKIDRNNIVKYTNEINNVQSSIKNIIDGIINITKEEKYDLIIKQGINKNYYVIRIHFEIKILTSDKESISNSFNLINKPKTSLNDMSNPIKGLKILNDVTVECKKRNINPMDVFSIELEYIKSKGHMNQSDIDKYKKDGMDSINDINNGIQKAKDNSVVNSDNTKYKNNSDFNEIKNDNRLSSAKLSFNIENFNNSKNNINEENKVEELSDIKNKDKGNTIWKI